VVPRPTIEDLNLLQKRLDLGLSSGEIVEVMPMIEEALRSYDRIATRAACDQRAPRTRGGSRPALDANPLGAWYWRTAIQERDTGLLAGKTVAIKDNICVAGVPMMNGSRVLDGYIPDLDATVVTRILEAGGLIAGKAVCESLTFSGSSFTSDSGPVLNPYDNKRSTGGSSSGCAALLAVGEVDLAIGGDQGGSIGIPSSWSGVYGLKPTFGLVPYTGAFACEMTLDHLGPMARTTADVALLLDVIAGPDGLDPRQNWATRLRPERGTYRAALTGKVGDLRIGILQEGFGWPETTQADVDEAVTAAAHGFEALGAFVTDVSVPEHRRARDISTVIECEGCSALALAGEGIGTNWRGLYVDSMALAFAKGRRRHSVALPATFKIAALVGEWMKASAGVIFYAKAQNLGRALTKAYDQALDEFDLLVLPTTPMKATLLPQRPLSLTESAKLAFEMDQNASPFCVTGHPAMTLPCAVSQGLPVGMMMIGKHGGEGTILRAAHAFEHEVFAAPEPLGTRHPPSITEISRSTAATAAGDQLP